MTGASLQALPDVDRAEVLKSLNLNPRDPKTQALLLVCDRYDLDPLLKHMVLIQGNPYVTRDGYLAIAHKSGQFDGMEVLDQGEDDTHYLAKVAVHRKDMARPFTFVGRFPKAKKMATDYGPEMAVKVAEVQALRRAFNVTGVGAADERWDDQAQVVEITPAETVDEATGEILPAVTRRPSPLQVSPPAVGELETSFMQTDDSAPRVEERAAPVPLPNELRQAKETKPASPTKKPSKAVASMMKSIRSEAKGKGMTDVDLSALVEEAAGLRSLDDLTSTSQGPAIFAALAGWGDA